VLTEKALEPIHGNRIPDLVGGTVSLSPPQEVALMTKKGERCSDIPARPCVLLGTSDHIRCCKAGGAGVEWALGETCEGSDPAAGERDAPQNAQGPITAPLEMRPELLGSQVMIENRHW
jgi:hypothetical protein